MLRIRQAQLDVLSEGRRRDFENRVLAHLKEVFPEKIEAAEGEEEVREWIRAGSGRAEGYGVRKERDLALFIDLDVGIEPEFETKRKMGWAQKILTDEELSGTAKIDLIYKLLPHRLEESGRRSR